MKDLQKRSNVIDNLTKVDALNVDGSGLSPEEIRIQANNEIISSYKRQRSRLVELLVQAKKLGIEETKSIRNLREQLHLVNRLIGERTLENKSLAKTNKFKEDETRALNKQFGVERAVRKFEAGEGGSPERIAREAKSAANALRELQFRSGNFKLHSNAIKALDETADRFGKLDKSSKSLDRIRERWARYNFFLQNIYDPGRVRRNQEKDQRFGAGLRGYVPDQQELLREAMSERQAILDHRKETRDPTFGAENLKRLEQTIAGVHERLQLTARTNILVQEFGKNLDTVTGAAGSMWSEFIRGGDEALEIVDNLTLETNAFQIAMQQFKGEAAKGLLSGVGIVGKAGAELLKIRQETVTGDAESEAAGKTASRAVIAGAAGGIAGIGLGLAVSFVQKNFEAQRREAELRRQRREEIRRHELSLVLIAAQQRTEIIELERQQVIEMVKLREDLKKSEEARKEAERRAVNEAVARARLREAVNFRGGPGLLNRPDDRFLTSSLTGGTTATTASGSTPAVNVTVPVGVYNDPAALGNFIDSHDGAVHIANSMSNNEEVFTSTFGGA